MSKEKNKTKKRKRRVRKIVSKEKFLNSQYPSDESIPNKKWDFTVAPQVEKVSDRCKLKNRAELKCKLKKCCDMECKLKESDEPKCKLKKGDEPKCILKKSDEPKCKLKKGDEPKYKLKIRDEPQCKVIDPPCGWVDPKEQTRISKTTQTPENEWSVDVNLTRANTMCQTSATCICRSNESCVGVRPNDRQLFFYEEDTP